MSPVPHPPIYSVTRLKVQSSINDSSTKPFVISGSQSLPNSQERFRDFWEVGINVPRRQEFLLQFFLCFFNEDLSFLDKNFSAKSKRPARNLLSFHEANAQPNSLERLRDLMFAKSKLLFPALPAWSVFIFLSHLKFKEIPRSKLLNPINNICTKPFILSESCGLILNLHRR